MPAISSVQPFSVFFEENQVLNRQFIELGGYLPSDVVTSRNRYELYEKLMDHGFWLLMAVAAPLLLGLGMVRLFSRPFYGMGVSPPVRQAVDANLPALQRLGAWIDGLGNRSPLQVPFEWLDRAKSFAVKPWQLAEVSRNLGLKTPTVMKNLLRKPEFIKAAWRGKLWILLADMALMASNSQIKLWFKNVMTAKLSGKEGFSGTMGYTNDAYKKAKTADYEKNKYTRMAISIGLALTSILGLPLLLRGLLKSKTPVGRGFIGQLKRLVPAFNYAQSIFMSKWVFLWYSMFNYVLGGVLSARDSNERREHLIKSLTLDFFFVAGDLIVSGLGARLIERWQKSRLGGIALAKRGTLVPLAVPLREVYERVGHNRLHPAYRWAQRNYWTGLVATTAFMALSIPLLIQRNTRKKVKREQAEQTARIIEQLQRLGGIPRRHTLASRLVPQ